MPGAGRLAFDRVDDGATANGAEQAARQLIGHDIDALIGPFGSDAVVGALHLYVAAGIPVFLPAATIDLGALPEGVFRLCPNDRAIAQAILDRIRERGFQTIRVLSDGSPHYLALKSKVERLLATAAVSTDDIVPAQHPMATVFLGRLEASRDWLRGFRQGGEAEPVLFSDDAADPSVTRELTSMGDVEALAVPDSRDLEGARPFAAHHRNLFGEEPGTYFHEVIAAVQLVANLALRRAAQSARSVPPCFDGVPTVFGPARFVGGENERATLVWKNLGAASTGVVFSQEARS
ncbi:ABC transporter substrate-binding protein [Stappia sp. ES.058]|uniref:ABC transporter substrate-binding protein n=1 Tax=Stappia sp. ES.058 TaxID=1881061 RepID=UPI0012FD24F8|nr:ABC transporter substrate-binding protein [Stappia sp. ES.058]